MAKPDLRISVLSDVHVTHFGAGEDAFEHETQKIVDYLSEKYPVEVDVKMGLQPVYSYIIGVE
jgi:dihydroxyacetone kinase-like predicted kinase